MFAKESIDKLKEVFKELVKPPEAAEAKRGYK
jgi:ribosomal protein L7/L12